ncbi:hypothetical protein SAMN05428966_102135 [Massilia sp. PDC64]|nr:hypothetical protein [Massilia sp. PDC64]SDC69647.1 hypothetical protein SAMN05428966_102135 [Massilia sp. PDC64]
MHAPTTNPTPATAPVLTPEQQHAQKVIDDGNVKAMLASCLPTLRAELYAAEFMHAEITRSRDVQTRKKKFMKAAGKITGGLPPMTETALRVVANSPKA